MSNAQTAAGVEFYIGAAAPATYDKAGYEAVTWVKVGEISNIGGDVGRMYNLATFALLEARGIVKRKGGYNNGSATIEYAYYRTDAGQEDLIAAELNDAPLPFKMVMTDTDTTHVYYMGLVMGTPISIGGAEDFLTSSVNIEIDSVSDVLEEDAPA